MLTTDDSIEVECPCCLGQGTVAGPEGKRPCPLCDGYRTVPQEIAERFVEVAARRMVKGEGG